VTDSPIEADVIVTDAQSPLAALLELLQPNASPESLAMLLRTVPPAKSRPPSEEVLRVGAVFREIVASVTLSNFAS